MTVGGYFHDEDITSSDMTMTNLYIHQPKVHMFYVRFTYYIFEQMLLHSTCLGEGKEIEHKEYLDDQRS
uniref:Uncharacterized protein n=1 Tax=Oryza sativa subsp. japonica TaxID=39947 RepID=Q109Z6_ORYSJ|nr:hypothetical protein LOC_Os10g11512 [Oryza sativa Japonica Group]